MSPRIGGSLPLLLAALLACSEERPVRSFVQPNLMRKADLAGTWYYVQTVLDSPPSNAILFTGLSSELIKGRFDIQPDFIYFRRSYEQIGGSEDMRSRDENGYYGQPLAAWRVERHFDLIRDYSSVTGEQSNRLIESEERHWQKREYVRVNWSENLVTDYVGIGLNMFFAKDDGVKIQPVSFWEADPTHPDALYKEFQAPPRDEKDARLMEFDPGDMTYFDVTNKLLLTPQEITLKFEENGVTETLTVPRCLLDYQIADCASQVVKVRHAFAKISERHHYVPRKWDGQQMERFGLWDVGLNRLTYNRQYGITNSGFTRTAARYNIWQKSYPTDASGLIKKIPCQLDEECGPDQVCGNYYEYTGGVETISRICQLHPRAREIRTIPYYAESSNRSVVRGKVGSYEVDEFAPDLFAEGKEVIRQWDEAMKKAYIDATKNRSAEALFDPENTGREPGQDIFVFCHNPVKMLDDENGPKDPEACWRSLQPLRTYDESGKPIEVVDRQGQPVYRARQGDPRRSVLFWVNQYQQGPLGYGPPLYDPQTGEIISGQAYIYGAALDTYTARSRDLALLITGQIKTDDFIRGTDVKRWVQDNRAGAAVHEATTLDHGKLMERAMAMDFDWAIGLAPEAKLDPSSVVSLKESLRARAERIYKTGVFGTGQGDPSHDRRKRLRGTPIEGMLIHPDQLAGLGRGGRPVPWAAVSDSEKARLSPLRAMAIQEAIQKRMEDMAALGVDHADFFEESIYQRVLLSRDNPDLWLYRNEADREARNPVRTCEDPSGARNAVCLDPEAVRKDLRKRIFTGVALHEVGHNVGLRHNFRSSYDSMNYFPKYWELRDKGRSATRDCFGRAYPPPKPEEMAFEGKLRPRYINRPGGALSDIECKGGIREYQYSSIMDYGAEFNADLQGLGSYDVAAMKFSIAEYYEAFTEARQDRLNDWSALQSASSSYGFPSPLRPSVDLDAIPYTQYPEYFDSGVAGMSKRIDVPVELTRNYNTPDRNPVYGVRRGSRVYPIVPYYFCSDEFAGNLTCQRFDGGADSFEQAQDIINRYNNYYLLNNFKRDRYQFWASAAYLGRLRSRYFNLLRQQMTWYTLLRGEFTDFLVTIARLTRPTVPPRQAAAEFFARENQWGSFTAAVSLGFDLFGDVLSRPSYGSFIQVPEDDSSDFPKAYWRQFRDRGFTDPGVHNLAIGLGRHENTTWDFDACGYYWHDQCTTRIGYFHDKRVALEVLTESQAYFTGRDTATDVRKYAIGYFRLFPAQLQDKLGAILAGDYTAYAPRFISPGDAGNNFRLAQRLWSTGAWSTASVPAEQDTVEPATGFTLQVQTGVNALANISAGFDRDFIENTQIFVVGNGEAPVPDSQLVTMAGAPGPLSTDNPQQIRSYVDPRLPRAAFEAALATKKAWLICRAHNDRTYAARSVPQVLVGQVPHRLDTGARMVEMLCQLDARYRAALALPDADPERLRKVAVTERAFKNYVMNIEVMRSLHKAYGYGPYKTDAPFVY